MNSPKAALVTGSAVRLGKAIALALAENGYDIALHYHSSQAEAEQTAREICQLQRQCALFSADLAQVETLEPLLQAALSQFPHLNLLVNSASAYSQGSLLQTTPASFDKQWMVNLRAPFFLMQAYARHVGQGNIINILDNKIAFNQYAYAAYLLSKKGLAELTQLAAIELAPAIRVNGIAPGVIMPASHRTSDYLQWRIQGIPLQKQGEVAQLTQAILAILGNDFLTGQILFVDGGESLTHIGRNAANYQNAEE